MPKKDLEEQLIRDLHELERRGVIYEHYMDERWKYIFYRAVRLKGRISKFKQFGSREGHLYFVTSFTIEGSGEKYNLEAPAKIEVSENDEVEVTGLDKRGFINFDDLKSSRRQDALLTLRRIVDNFLNPSLVYSTGEVLKNGDIVYSNKDLMKELEDHERIRAKNLKFHQGDYQRLIGIINS